MATTTTTNTCAICQAPASKRCGRCKAVWYCDAAHQRQDWPTHKAICNDAVQADQYTLHKQEFDRIVKAYQLDSAENSEAIATFLTSNDSEKVSAAEFAQKFGVKNEEAVVFLEWIKVGVKFKETSIDTAKKSGFAKPL